MLVWTGAGEARNGRARPASLPRRDRGGPYDARCPQATGERLGHTGEQGTARTGPIKPLMSALLSSLTYAIECIFPAQIHAVPRHRRSGDEYVISHAIGGQQLELLTHAHYD